MKILNVQQNTPDWHTLREKSIGASDSVCLMGFHQWTTPLQLYKQKKSGIQKEKTARMQRGLDLEEKARMLFEEGKGVMVFPTVVQHAEYPWMIASLDGLCMDGLVAVEIKCPGDEDHKLALQGKVPDKYYPQIQHQLAVTGLNEMYYFSYDGDPSSYGACVKVQRDDEYIAELIEVEKEFYHCMMNDIEPELSEKDHLEVVADLEQQDIIYSYIIVSKELKELEQREKAYKKQISSWGDDGNIQFLDYDNKPLVKLTRVNRDAAVDLAALCAAYGIEIADTEKFRKPQIGYYKITV